MLATTSRLKRQGMDFPLKRLEEAQPCQELGFSSAFQGCERICFCNFKPPSLWWFVTAPSGNEYTWSDPKSWYPLLCLTESS